MTENNDFRERLRTLNREIDAALGEPDPCAYLQCVTAPAVEELRRAIPSIRPFVQAGDWERCKAVFCLWFAYWLARGIVRAEVKAALAMTRGY